MSQRHIHVILLWFVIGPDSFNVPQVKGAAHTAGIGFAGENALPRYDATAYGTIEAQASSLGFLINDFTYLRLSDTLLQSNNFGSFRNFVQQMANLSPSSE